MHRPQVHATDAPHASRRAAADIKTPYGKI